MPNLPKLLFCENHADPSTSHILNKLLPYLSEKGYKFYYDESTEQLEQRIKNLGMEIEADQEFKLLLDSWGCDTSKLINTTNTKLAVEDFIVNLLKIKPQLKNDIGLEKLYVDIYNIARFRSKEENYIFLTNFQSTNSIQYKGIDVDGNDPCSLEGMIQRDEAMSNAYIEQKEGVFGRIGLQHARGIQKNIENKLSYEEIHCQYFYIYSKNSATKLENEAINDPSGSIIAININGRNDDDVIQEILQIINCKINIAQLNETSDKKKYPVSLRDRFFASSEFKKYSIASS